ncbi:MAG TPA: TraR/DksA C4-type zinc finger protein [Chondromyces sp.]|nr:TraR/DksA C4-type zinc finger protein [Chondromyces sp.]
MSKGCGIMLSDKQIAELKNELLEQKRQISEQTKSSDNNALFDSERIESGELSSYDNHPADLGTELHDREAEIALQDHHENELEKINTALQAIEDGTYGTCLVCQKDISYDRLLVLPATLYCADHTERPVDSDYRPVEEDILQPPQADTFQKHRQPSGIRDYKDSFAEAAQYGTSETPADFIGDYEDYNDLYRIKNDGFPEEYESFTATDIVGQDRGYVRSENEQDLEETLESEDMDSQLGNIPYKKKDSYIDE